MPSSIESQFSKFISAFEKRMAVFDQKMAALDARLDAMKAGSREPERTFSPGNNYVFTSSNYARQLNSQPRGRLGNCYGCWHPGHFKRNCPKLMARTKPQAGNTKKEPSQASGRDRRPQYSRAQPVQGSNRNRAGLAQTAVTNRGGRIPFGNALLRDVISLVHTPSWLSRNISCAGTSPSVSNTSVLLEGTAVPSSHVRLITRNRP